MSCERQIINKLLENVTLYEASFKLNGIVYTYAFGKYYEDNEPITREEYMSAREKYDSGDESGKEVSNATNIQYNNMALKSLLVDYMEEINVFKSEKIDNTEGHLDYISSTFDRAEYIIENTSLQDYEADIVVESLVDYSSDNTQPDKERSNYLEKFLLETPPFYNGGLLYRGMSINDEKVIDRLMSYNKGDSLELLGYTGFSTNKDVAVEFANDVISEDDKRVLIINSRNLSGVSITAYSEFPNEEEVLYRKQAKLLIEDVREIEGVIMVHVKESLANESAYEPKKINIGLIGNQHVDK